MYLILAEYHHKYKKWHSSKFFDFANRVLKGFRRDLYRRGCKGESTDGDFFSAIIPRYSLVPLSSSL